MPTSPGVWGTKSRTSRAAVSNRRRVTSARVPGRRLPVRTRARASRTPVPVPVPVPGGSAERAALAAVRRHDVDDLVAPHEVHDVEPLHDLARLGVPEPHAVPDLEVARAATGAVQRRLDLAGALAPRERPPGRRDER